VDKLAWVLNEGLVGPGLGVMRSLSDSYSVADLELSPFSEVDAGEHGRGMTGVPPFILVAGYGSRLYPDGVIGSRR
jgi:hypothetical protein